VPRVLRCTGLSYFGRAEGRAIGHSRVTRSRRLAAPTLPERQPCCRSPFGERVFAAALLTASHAIASPSGVVISGFQVRGPAGGNDEYVEIRNTSGGDVSISGWKLEGLQEQR